MNRIAPTAVSLLLAALVSAWAPPALAQSNYAKTSQIWASQGRISDISVTGSSGATQLPAIGQIARLCNTGANDAYVAFGPSGVAVTVANGSKLVAGTCWGYDLMPFPAPVPFQYVAAITASSTTTIYVETGIGSPPLQIGSSGGGGSNASVGTTGATAPTSATLTGMIQGGNLVAMTGTAGNLNVQCANCSGSGVSTVDQAAFAVGSSLFAGGGGFFQTVATNNPLSTGTQGLFQVTANRALFSNLRNAAGAEVGVAAVPLQVSLANTGANATAMLVTGTAGTFPVTGTVTANAGTNLNTSALALETGGNLAQIVTDFGAPGAAACATDTASCSLNQQIQRLAQRLTTINTTLGSPFQAGGALAANQSVNVAQINGVTTLTGNGVTGAGSQRVTISSDNTAFTVNAAQSGTWSVTAVQPTGTNLHMVCDSGCSGSGGTSSTFGAAFPTVGTAIGLTNGTNMVAWSATSNYGTAPSAIPVPAVNAFVTGAIGIAQGSTTSGQTGSLVMGAASTNAPTSTTADTWPISISPASGGIRIDLKDTAANTNPFLVNQPTAANFNATVVGTGTLAVQAAATATEVHSGEVGNNQIRVQVAQTVTASSAYTAGNAVGGLVTVANAARVSGSLGASGSGGILQNVAVNSKSVQTAQMDIFIFDANPTGSTCTDKTAFVLATADFDKVIGVVSVPSTVTNNSGWFSGGTGSVGQGNNQALAYDLSSATSLFACVVTRGTPTFTATSDISLKFQMLRS